MFKQSRNAYRQVTQSVTHRRSPASYFLRPFSTTYSATTTAAKPTDNDDPDIIRKVFDDNVYWQSFNGDNNRTSSFFNYKSNSVGLFQNPYLKRPSGLKDFSAESLEKAKQLTQAIIDDNSKEGLINYIRNLDRLSDILCRVIDLCEFVRVVHPNKSFINAAQSCHEEMFEFMNILNTSKELYDKLHLVLTSDEIKSHLTKEELAVGQLLFADFKKSGIDMDENTRQQFVSLSQNIAVMGQYFNNGVADPVKDFVLIPKEKINEGDINKNFKSLVSHDLSGNLKIPIYGKIPFEILRSTPNKFIREEVWNALHSAPDMQIQYLQELLKYRGILAHLLGSNSFSNYQLNEKMARTPENVMSFLRNLLTQVQPGLTDEIKTLYKMIPNKKKARPNEDELSKSVRPWDRDYLTTLYLMKQRSSNLQDISEYFSIGTVVQGLSNLFNSIYGIQLKPVKAEAGETWSNDVRKFEVISEVEGIIGIIYLDLFYRDRKTHNPAHFTVCCSRKIYPEELNPNDQFKLSLNSIRTNETVNGEIFQLPVISLVCNFVPDSSSSDAKTLLTLNQVETLFHEMGHAMHSMLGRTNLHNVSGTRCSTDFVELPSILMEHFAKDERVLLSFARHHETGESLPLSLLKKHQEDNDFLNKCETFSQIKMAILDQALHSELVFNQNFGVVTIYHDMEKELKYFNDNISNWPGKFGHLFSYGSVYYSYLFDRAIAANIWEHLFKENPLDRKSGENFKNKVLKWGGSKDPWELLADVLDNPELKAGDSKAMAVIGNTKEI